MSSLIQSAFDPSGKHIAYLLQTLDVQTLKVQAVGKDTADRSVIVHPFDKRVRSEVNQLEWLGADVVGVTFVGSNVCELLNVQSNEILAELKTDRLISALRVSSSKYGRVLVVDASGSLLEYQLTAGLDGWTLQGEWNIEVKGVTKIWDYSDRYAILFSNSALLFDRESGKVVDSKSLYVTSVKNVVDNGDGCVAVSAENDRFINLLSVGEDGKLKSGSKLLVTENPVLSISWKRVEEFKLEAFVALTEGGVVEVFNEPFKEAADGANGANGANGAASPKKKKRRAAAAAANGIAASVRSNGSIELVRPNRNEPLPIVNLLLDSKYLDIAWLEESSYLTFDYVTWWSHPAASVYQYSVTELTQLEKERPNSTLSRSRGRKGEDLSAAKHYNEGATIVSSGNNYKDLDHVREGDEDDDDDNDDDDDDDFAHLAEKYRGADEGLVKKKSGKLQVGSLTTVLSQALKSNDHGLLESVLNNNRDETVIKNTVSKLDTAYVLALLDRLSERLSRGKGSRSRQQQQQLETWVKYILIYHGSYLISLPHLNADINLLTNSLRMRSRNLGRLLKLKGKLGMLTEGMETRRELNSLQKDATKEEDEADVEYVEEIDDAGLESDDESDSDSDASGSDLAEMEVDEDEDEEAREGRGLTTEDEDLDGQYSDVEDM